MFTGLKNLRRKNKVTCDEMSKLLGFKTRGAYNKKENGEVPFSLQKARTISVYFKEPIENIFFAGEVSIQETMQNVS